MQQQPAPAPVPPIPAVASPGQPAGSPAEILQGLRAQRDELERQLEQLTDQREEISSELQEPLVRGANQQGLEARIRLIDQHIGEEILQHA